LPARRSFSEGGAMPP